MEGLAFNPTFAVAAWRRFATLYVDFSWEHGEAKGGREVGSGWGRGFLVLVKKWQDGWQLEEYCEVSKLQAHVFPAVH